MKQSNLIPNSMVSIISILYTSVSSNYTEGRADNETRHCIFRLTTEFYGNQKDVPLVIHLQVSLYAYVFRFRFVKNNISILNPIKLLSNFNAHSYFRIRLGFQLYDVK